jgi:hypothetical protein
MTKENSVLIAVVQDKSGSMEDVRAAAISGFNEFLQSQKALPGEARFSLIQFDTTYAIRYLGKPIKDVEPLTEETYKPGGGTALLDAIGRIITETGKYPERSAGGGASSQGDRCHPYGWRRKLQP